MVARSPFDFASARIRITDYLRYRAEIRGYRIDMIEGILRGTGERYFDTETRRMVAVGRHGDLLVLVPYETDNEDLTPVTVHTTTRQQVNFRLKSGRFTHG